METLSGYSISQFQVFGKSDRISADDRFFTSQPISYVAAYREYESKSLEYDLLLKQIFNDLSSAFGFKSMAYELSDAYSRVQHVHQYNSFDIKSDYGVNGNVVLATFKVNDKVVRLCMPRQWVYKVPDPVIGELKYKMLPTVTNPDNININSTNFDGWVYPRGQSYTVTAADFQGAKACFGQSLTATTLIIPNINNFVKADPRRNIRAQTVPFNNQGIPAHHHSSSIQIGAGSYDDYAVKAEVTKSPGSGGALHNGAEGYKPAKYFESTLVFHATSLDVKSCEIGNSESGLDREQYPSYNYLPIMIYIGKKSQ